MNNNKLRALEALKLLKLKALEMRCIVGYMLDPLMYTGRIMSDLEDLEEMFEDQVKDYTGDKEDND